jgi:hypothetical protein
MWDEVGLPHYEHHPLLLPPQAERRTWRVRRGEGTIRHVAGGDGLEDRLLATRPLWIQYSATLDRVDKYAEIPFYVTGEPDARHLVEMMVTDFAIEADRTRILQSHKATVVLVDVEAWRGARRGDVRDVLDYFSVDVPPGARGQFWPARLRYRRAYDAILEEWAQMGTAHLAQHLAAKTPLASHLHDVAAILARLARREAAEADPWVHRYLHEEARCRSTVVLDARRTLLRPWIPLPGSIHVPTGTLVRELHRNNQKEGTPL